MHAIETDVRQFVVENFLFGEAGDLGNGDSFLESGIIDSTGILELVGFLERTYGIAVEDHDVVPSNLDSVERVARYVRGKLSIAQDSLAG